MFVFFMNNQEESIKVQVHHSSKDELLKEKRHIRKRVNKMTSQIVKLPFKENVN